MYGTPHSFLKLFKSVQNKPGSGFTINRFLNCSIKFDFASALNLRWTKFNFTLPTLQYTV